MFLQNLNFNFYNLSNLIFSLLSYEQIRNYPPDKPTGPGPWGPGDDDWTPNFLNF